MPDPSPTSRRGATFELAGIVALCLALNLAGNGRVSLWDRDEPRYAGCTREMMARGDWLRPTFNGVPRHDKPVLVYWLMRAGFALGGDNPFGARLASAIAGVLTCAGVWALGRSMFGATEGRWAALVAATAPILVAESKLATTDATLCLLVLVGQGALWRLRRGESRTAAAAFWVALGLSTLTKGPVGPLLLGASMVGSRCFGGPSAWNGRLCWRRGLPLCGLIAVPWFAAIGVLTGGEFFRVAVGYHVVQRASQSIEEHVNFPGYYPVTMLLGFYPWSSLLPASLAGAWSRRRMDPAFGFLLGWAVGPLVVLELARTKLPHYYLPSVPACALLAGWLVARVSRSGVSLRAWPLGRIGLGLLIGVGVVGSGLVAASATWVPSPLAGPCLSLSAIIAAGAICSWSSFRRGETARAAGVLAGGWALTSLLFCGWVLPAAEPYRLTGQVARRLVDLGDAEGAGLLLASFHPPGVIYELKHPAETMASRDDLYRRVVRAGKVVSALSTAELAAARRDPRIDVAERGAVRGFHVEKASTLDLHLVLIRPSSSLAALPDRFVR